MCARVIWRSMVCLGIATLLTIGNAWWFAIRHNGFAPMRDVRWGLALHGEDAEWMVKVNIWFGSSWAHSEVPYRPSITSWPDRSAFDLTAEDALPYWAARARMTAALGPRETRRVDVVAHGWPFRAMQLSYEDRVRKKDGFASGIAVHPPDWLRGKRPMPQALISQYLPLDPIWPGFAANTMLYASVIVVVTSAGRKLRRVHRRRRGRCLACGYPMGETDRCSECGGNVRSARQPKHQ